VHSSLLRNVLLAVAGAGTFAAVLGGCSGGTSSTSPSISPPPVTTTGSPPPTLLLQPSSSLTFAPGQGGTQQVSVIPPNPSYENVAIVKDTCTSKLIATAAQSPEPNPTPTPGTVPPIYNVTSGSKDGSCNFVFQDMVSNAKATLAVTNDSGGKSTPTPIPTPTPTSTSTGSGNGLTFTCSTGPCTSFTFTKGEGPQNITVDYEGGGDAAATLTGDSCSGPGIATASPFDYGIWTLTPGKNNGTCSFTWTDSSVNPPASGTLGITNNANAAVRALPHPH